MAYLSIENILFINALNISQGQLPGKPGYGTTLWSFIFDPNTADVQFELETVHVFEAFPHEFTTDNTKMLVPFCKLTLVETVPFE